MISHRVSGCRAGYALFAGNMPNYASNDGSFGTSSNLNVSRLATQRLLDAAFSNGHARLALPPSTDSLHQEGSRQL